MSDTENGITRSNGLMNVTREGLLRGAAAINDNEHATLVRVVADNMDEAFPALREKLKNIKSDRTLTHTGKQSRKRELCEKFAETVDALALPPQTEAITKRIGFLENRMAGSFTQLMGADVEDAREVRQLIREMRKSSANGDLEVVNLLMEAASEGDKATLAAFVQAPRAFPLATEAQLEEAAKSYERAIWPNESREIKSLESVLSTMKDNAGTAKVAAVRLAGLSNS